MAFMEKKQRYSYSDLVRYIKSSPNFVEFDCSDIIALLLSVNGFIDKADWDIIVRLLDDGLINR